MKDYAQELKELKSMEIEVIQIQKGKLGYSAGIIKEIKKYEIIYSSSTEINTSGYSIFLKGNTKVIDIQKSSEIICFWKLLTILVPFI